MSQGQAIIEKNGLLLLQDRLLGVWRNRCFWKKKWERRMQLRFPGLCLKFLFHFFGLAVLNILLFLNNIEFLTLKVLEPVLLGQIVVIYIFFKNENKIWISLMWRRFIQSLLLACVWPCDVQQKVTIFHEIPWWFETLDGSLMIELRTSIRIFILWKLSFSLLPSFFF